MFKKSAVFLLSFFFLCAGGWTQSYSLEDLKKAMLDNNTELLLLSEEYNRSRLDLRDAKAGLGPSIDLQVTGTYMVNPPVDAVYLNVDDILNSVQWPSGMAPASSGRYVKVYDGMENTYYNFALSMTQPLFTWGKIANSIKIYSQICQVKETQIEAKKQTLETELETRLVTLFYLKKINEILNEEKDYASRMVTSSENAEKSGMLLHQEVVEARIKAKELEIAREDVFQQVNEQLLEIKNLTGLEKLTEEEIFYQPDENSFSLLSEMDRSEALEKAVSGAALNIKLLTLLEEVQATAEQIARGYENWKPDLALQLSTGYGGSRFPLFEENYLRKDDYSLNISVGIKTTVWDGGKKLNDVSRKISEVKTARINKTEARNTIEKTLSSQWNNIDVCSMKIEYEELKIESAASKIKQQETVFASGYGSENDLLSAKISYCNECIEKEKHSLSKAVSCMTVKALINY